MENIFNYAKKELSQDAVIACILNEPDQDSIRFIQSMLGGDCPKKFEIKKVSMQDGKIDIFVEIEVSDVSGSHLEGIIIEDKTNTFLHDGQLKKYIDTKICAKVKYDKIYFVLFKTGNYYFWERDKYKKEQGDYFVANSWAKGKVLFKTYLLDNFQKFLKGKVLRYGWYEDYKDYITAKTISSTWQTNLKNSSYDFVNEITSGRYGATGSKDYDFGKPGGNGDEGYELWLQGIRGPYDPNSTSGITPLVKNCYYLLPIVVLQSPKNHFIIKLNFHLNVKPKVRHGYVPYGELKGFISKPEIDEYDGLHKRIRYELTTEFAKEGFDVNSGKKDGQLLLFKYEGKIDHIKYFADAKKELEGKLNVLFKEIDQIIKKYF